MTGALLHWTWELPQTLLGAAVLGVLRARHAVYGVERLGGRQLVETRRLGISLGHYVFWARCNLDGSPTDAGLIRAHEWGHTVQSRRLGWLYLLTVGIASSSRALYAMLYHRRYGQAWPHYFDAWPEDAADQHGGIVRVGTTRPPRADAMQHRLAGRHASGARALPSRGQRVLVAPPLSALARRPDSSRDT